MMVDKLEARNAVACGPAAPSEGSVAGANDVRSSDMENYNDLHWRAVQSPEDGIASPRVMSPRDQERGRRDARARALGRI